MTLKSIECVDRTKTFQVYCTTKQDGYHKHENFRMYIEVLQFVIEQIAI